jgi:hypothetical protein
MRTGRPREGTRIDVRVPSDVLAEIDDEAKRRGLSRGALIRVLLRAGLRVTRRNKIPRI